MNVSTLQPIINVTLQDGSSLGSTEKTLACDRDAGEFASLPLGMKASKLSNIADLPAQLN